MIEIKRNRNRTFTFICDDYILPLTLIKVEKVAENSNYYSLWINEMEFYLFNVHDKKYALKTNTYKAAKTFYKIEYYSETSKTFVAYRNDKDYAYILFDNGDFEDYIFKYVGKEYNGIRPVKGHNERWVYYNVPKKRFLYNISNGLLLDDDEELVQCYNYNCYTIYKYGLYYRIILFDINSHKTYYSDRYNFFEEVIDDKIIGKIYNKNIYALLRKSNPTLPIGYYTSKPRYVAKSNVFIAKKINSFVVISNKEISNCQWIEDAFIFHKNYILNKSSSGKWKIYSFCDGKEICTNWTNIRFDPVLQRIVADTEKGKNQIIDNNDINNLSKLLYEKSKRYYECIKSKIIQQKENESTDIPSVPPKKRIQEWCKI